LRGLRRLRTIWFIGVNKVCRILKNSYSGIRDPDRPIGSFVFGGATGTGKTHLSKELAKAIFGKESALIRLDMTEYSESHSVSKLIGSPPGYVGFAENDVFIDKVKRKPYSIILLDELEKAHPDVVKLFMQVMSDGMMTDAIGNKVDFKNIILIMTGNFMMNDVAKKSMGFDSSDNKPTLAKINQDRLVSYCKDTYGEEFVNRIDEFIAFENLNDESLKSIMVMQMNEIVERLKNRKCNFKYSDAIFEKLLRISKDEHGANANPIRRLIVKLVEPCISDTLLSMGNSSCIISLDVIDDEFVAKGRKNGNKK
jgi:ATP-dependent Clp protease ATP-binding subunit ClpC